MAITAPATQGVISLVSSADYRTSSRLYHVMAIHTTRMQGVVAGDEGLYALGILINEPLSGEAMEIFVGPGICPVYCGATTTIRYPLSCNSSGEVINATDDDNIIGYALEAGASGEIVNAFINSFGNTSTISDMQ